MTAPTDLYAILDVAPTADAATIRAAYKALMRKVHPDTNHAIDAHGRAAAINQAYAVLNDPARRSAYDAEQRLRGAGIVLPRQGPTKPPPAPPRRPAPGAVKQPIPKRSQRVAGSRLRDWTGAIVILGAMATTLVVAGSRNGESEPARDSLALVAAEAAAPLPAEIAGDDAPPAAPSIATLKDAPELSAPVGNPAPASLSFDDIERAATAADIVIIKGGIAGARWYSENCHLKARKAPNWAAADRCAAFDYAVSYADSRAAAIAGKSGNAYFTFQRDNQSDHYAALGALPYSVAERLLAIRHAAEPAMADASRVRIERAFHRDSREP